MIRKVLAEMDKGKVPSRFVPDAATGIAETMFSIAGWLNDEQTIDAASDLCAAGASDEEGFSLSPRSSSAISSNRPAATIRPSRPMILCPRPTCSGEQGRYRDRGKPAPARARRGGIGEDFRGSGCRFRQLRCLADQGRFPARRKRFTEAAEAYTRALSLIAKPDRNHALVYYFRGIAYERSAQWDKAEADFRKSLALLPDQANVLNYLGYSMVDKRINLPEALQMIRKAVELKPNDGYIVDSLGWAHFQLGEYEEAVKHLERAVELRPEDPIINEHLGDAYWRAGRRLEARFQWQHAKDNKPEPAGSRKRSSRSSNRACPTSLPVPADHAVGHRPRR